MIDNPIAVAAFTRTDPARGLSRVPVLLLGLTLAALIAPAPAQSQVQTTYADAAERLLAGLPAHLGEVVDEILDRNPELARLRAEAEAAAQRAPQVRALPDPMASLTAFLSTPETRVGPQLISASFSQRFPWFGTLKLKEQQALFGAAGSRLEVEAKRLKLVTEARRLAWELAYLEAEREAVLEDRDTLSHFEELARARYASGVGLGQAVVKLQAEITKDDNRLLRIDSRRSTLVASLNALRDRPAGDPLPAFRLAEAPEVVLPASSSLLDVAAAHRPEVSRSKILTEAAGLGVDLAEKQYRPDFTIGLGVTIVGDREDPAGIAMPPPDNGDDIIGLTLGVNLPVRRKKLAAGVLEATARESAARDRTRGILAEIEGSLGDLTSRLPLTLDQRALFDELLVIQAEEALRSAEAAYASGSQSALDLLDAERVLLDVRIASARAHADSLILHAQLEGALGAPSETLRDGDKP